MSVWLSLKSLKRDSSELVILNDMQASTGFTVQAGMDWGSVLNPGIFSSSIDTEGGSKVGERLENRVIQFQVVCGTGDTLASVKTAWQSLEAMIVEVNKFKGLLRFRSSQYSYGVTFEVEHIDVSSLWSKPAELGGHIIPTLSLTCKPYALMDAMDIEDDFSADTFGTDGKYNNGGSDWTADAGALTNVTISSGVLAGSANLSTENRFIHTGTPYEVSDAEVVVSFNLGTTYTLSKVGAIVKRVDASNYLEVYVVEDTGAKVKIDKIVAGSRTNLYTSASMGFSLSASDDYTISAQIRRNTITATVWYTDTDKQLYQHVGSGAAQYSYNLSTSEMSIFGETIKGTQGISFTPRDTATIYYFKRNCYTTRSDNNGNWPSYTMIQDSIYGGVPALASIESTDVNAGSQMLIGWGDRPTPVNMIWNSGFNDGDNSLTEFGWRISSTTGFNAAATSISRQTNIGIALDGQYYGEVVTSATSGSGCHFPIFKKIQLNVTYTFSVYLRASSSTTSMVIKLGNSTSSATSSASALTSSWQLYTVSWTPTSISNEPIIASIQTNAATITTFNIDRAVVSENGYTLDTVPSDVSEDMYPGGATILDRIHSANMFVQSSGSATRASDSSLTNSMGTSVSATGVKLAIPLMLDQRPVNDAHALQVYGRVKLSSGTTTASLVPRIFTTDTNGYYSVEYGSSGANIINSKPSSSTAVVNVFLGTIIFPSSGEDVQRVLFQVQTNYTGTVPVLDYFVLIPSNQVAHTMIGLTGSESSLVEFNQGYNPTTYEYDGSVSRTHYKNVNNFMRNKTRIGGVMLGGQPRLTPGKSAQFFIMPSNVSVNHNTPAVNDNGVSGGYHDATIRIRVQPRVLMVGD